LRIEIEIDTDADPSQVLDFTQELTEGLVETLKDYGWDVEVGDDPVTVYTS
jgi:hypothetical protein